MAAATRIRTADGRPALAAFSTGMADDPGYFFRCSGDRYQHIMGCMSRHTSGLKKYGGN
jgi:hypothetical protein